MATVFLTVLWLGGFSAVLMWGALIAEGMTDGDE